MNNYGFHFAESYQGYWNIAQIGRKIPGTLYIEKHSIRLELFWNNITSSDIRAISSVTGYAFTEHENKKSCYYFVLKELQLMSVSWFGKHQSQFKLDVDYLCMSDIPRFTRNGIVNCCIRTQLMDKWVWDYTQNSYSELWPFKENDIIPVARVYTYLDNALPKLYDEAALKGKKKLFRDSDGNTYLDPESETAYSYIKDIINELSSMGITDIVLDGCTVNETDYFSKLTSRLNNDIEGELRFYKAVSAELKGFDAESEDINEAGIKNDISKFPKPGENSVLIIKTDLEEESYKAFLEEKGITAYITES